MGRTCGFDLPGLTLRSLKQVTDNQLVRCPPGKLHGTGTKGQMDFVLVCRHNVPDR